MIHEIFGLDDVMRRHADHLTGLGYLTLAVDLFSSGGTARCRVSTMTVMMGGHGRAFAETLENSDPPLRVAVGQAAQAMIAALRAASPDRPFAPASGLAKTLG
jgi:dienelactone hydrolase